MMNESWKGVDKLCWINKDKKGRGWIKMANEIFFKWNEYEMYTHSHWLKGQADTQGWTNV
jgi:hypothetical protein